MAQQTTYFIDINNALRIVEQNIQQAELKKSDEYSDVNYMQIINDLNQVKRQITRMLNVYKYLRLSKSAFLNSLNNPGTFEILHTVTSYDTPLSIARQYGITLDELLQTNNVRAEDITAGSVIKIETTQQQYTTAVYENIAVYGAQDGLNILGTDAPDEIAEGIDGDVRILGNEDTIKQGIVNRISTRAGDYPGEEDFGIDGLIGGDIPVDLKEGMLIVKVLNQLALDPRITDAQNLITETTGNETTITAGNIYVLNNNQPVTL